MRNWFRTLRPASFRGVPFKVKTERLGKFGREIVVHRYVKAETHGTEDMGRLPREFSVTAYIADDQADSLVQALIRAVETEGPGTLVLPFFGAHQVRARANDGEWDKELLGYVGIGLDFVEAGQSGGGFPAIPLGDRIAEGLLDGVAGIVAAALAAVPADLGSAVGIANDGAEGPPDPSAGDIVDDVLIGSDAE